MLNILSKNFPLRSGYSLNSSLITFRMHFVVNHFAEIVGKLLYKNIYILFNIIFYYLDFKMFLKEFSFKKGSSQLHFT